MPSRSASPPPAPACRWRRRLLPISTASAANLVSAGLRLIPLGQTDGQRALQGLAPVVAACVAAALTRPEADFGGCALAAELASIDHETQYTRLFRS